MDVSHAKPSDDLQRQLDRQKTENQQQRQEVEHLRQMLVERDTIIEQQDQRLLVDHETQATQTVRESSYCWTVPFDPSSLLFVLGWR